MPYAAPDNMKIEPYSRRSFNALNVGDIYRYSLDPQERHTGHLRVTDALNHVAVRIDTDSDDPWAMHGVFLPRGGRNA